MRTLKRMARLHARIDAQIAEHGRMIIGVFPTAEEPLTPFLYTIGNHLKGLPELLLVGMCDDTFALNALSKRMIERGRKFDDGEVVDLGGACPVCVVDADDRVKADYTVQATEHFGGDDYAVMQVVLPDPEGRFPWQKGCRAPYSKMPVHRRAAIH